jgi:probable HAF family extracellular repeat protein
MSAWHSLPTRTAGAALVALAAFTASCRETDEPTAPTLETAQAVPNGDPTVSSVVPDSSGRATTLDITVNGSGFDQGSAVSLERQGVPAAGITTNSTTFVTPRKLIASITIEADADTGKYDVAVTTSGGRKGVGIELFNVLYELVEVGVIGGTWSLAAAINDLGQVVGTSCTQDCLAHAFLWSESGGLEDLGTLPGYSRSSASSVNNLGQVLGRVFCLASDPGCGGTQSAEVVLWEKAGDLWTATRLGIPTFGFADVGDINNSGQFVLGGGQVYSLSGGTAVSEPLPPLAPSPAVVSATYINDVGIVAGQSTANDVSGTAEAVIWFRGQSGDWRILPLGHLPGHNISFARDIGEVDAAGRIAVVGNSALAGSRDGYSPVRWALEPDGAQGWRVAAIEALQLPPKARGAEAWGVNTAGEVVGEYQNGNRPAAAKWLTTGSLEKLPSPNRGMTRARDINQGSLIVGSVWDNLRACERAALWRLR